MRLLIKIDDFATPRLLAFLAGLKRRAALHRMMGGRVQNVTRDHLIRIANTRHATANRLGAAPSGHWGKAAEKVTRPEALTISDDVGELVINHPGITRAFKDITIVPTGGRQFLTIPLIAAAYNRRARTIPGLFRPTRKGARATGFKIGADGRKVPIYPSDQKMRVLSRNGQGGLVHYYALVRSVLQRQDRTLLPGDKELQRACKAGILDYVRLLRKGGVKAG